MYAIYLYCIIKFIIDTRDSALYLIPLLKFIRFAVMSCAGASTSAVELSKGWTKIDIKAYAETSRASPRIISSLERDPDASLSRTLNRTSSATLDGLGTGLRAGLGTGLGTGLGAGRGAGLGAGLGAGDKSGQIGGQLGETSTQFPDVQHPKSSNFL